MDLLFLMVLTLTMCHACTRDGAWFVKFEDPE